MGPIMNFDKIHSKGATKFINPYWQIMENSSRNFLKLSICGSSHRPLYWETHQCDFLTEAINDMLHLDEFSRKTVSEFSNKFANKGKMSPINWSKMPKWDVTVKLFLFEKKYLPTALSNYTYPKFDIYYG